MLHYLKRIFGAGKPSVLGSGELESGTSSTAIPFLSLLRVLNSDDSTIGVLRDAKGNHVCFTLEPPWRDNERNVSCIPEGHYECEVVEHRDFGRTLLLRDVPQRSGIYFHIGNFLRETRGCPLPGLQATEIKVFHSTAAMTRIRALIYGRSSVTLEIRKA